ncbi:SIMPL domain-containing protein [Guptibacillus algicola]|uniref:SIMPL domain-containing protein n=1 Tax=Guptibacillus algicola TaxID=225844 RepID=UPI001CD7A799|nr:SIMPL domain-containing protein [Alkalihalobacillus algicola]MCA0988383.1 SIMPL domain-containing protein [Alkalihalobacillus algicola]
MDEKKAMDDCACDHTITVMGTGSIDATPDRGIAVLGVETLSSSITEAQQENAATTSSIITSLTNMGIPPNQIGTAVYQIEEEYKYEDNKKIFLGYKVTHLLKVVIDDVALTGMVVDSAVEAGATTISSITFDVQNKEPYYRKAQRNAIKQAKSKAKNISKALELPLPKAPYRVIESGVPSTISARSVAYSATPIQPGQISITADITLIYLLAT